jgi:hypothetical protein
MTQDKTHESRSSFDLVKTVLNFGRFSKEECIPAPSVFSFIIAPVILSSDETRSSVSLVSTRHLLSHTGREDDVTSCNV